MYLTTFSLTDTSTSQIHWLVPLNETYPTNARTKMKHKREWGKEKMTTLAQTSIPKLPQRSFSVRNKHPLNFLKCQIDCLVTDLFPNEYT